MDLDANIAPNVGMIGAARELALSRRSWPVRLYCRFITMLRTTQALLRMNVGALAVSGVLYITLASIFCDAVRFTLKGGKFLPIDYFLWAINLLLLFLTGELHIPFRVWLFIALLMFSGAYGIAYIGENPVLFLKEFIGISGCVIYFSSFFRSQRISAHKIFEMYVDAATIVCAMALLIYPFEIALNLRNRFGGRLHFPMTEPAMFSLATLPALYYVAAMLLKDWKSGRKREDIIKFLLLFTANGLAMSSVGFLDMLIMVIFLLRRRKLLLLMSPIIVGVIGVLLYYTIGHVQSRVDALLNFFVSQDVGQANNESVFIMAKCAFVAIVGFMQHPILGNGLGSYKMVHDRVLSQLVGSGQFIKNTSMLQGDAEDGFGWLIRMTAEFGSVGLILFAGFILRFWPRGDSTRSEMGRAALLTFIHQLFHTGSYFAPPTYFFAIIYVLLWYEDKHISTGVATAPAAGIAG